MPASPQRMQHDARRSVPLILVLVPHRENITAVGTTPTPPGVAGVAETCWRITRMLCCRSDERCHIVPSPLAGRDREGGATSTEVAVNPMSILNVEATTSKEHPRRCLVATPLPVPPPQGGREPCGVRPRNS